MAQNSKKSKSSKKINILVTGDVIRDIFIFTGESPNDPLKRNKGTSKIEAQGGAYYSYSILMALIEDCQKSIEAQFGLDEEIFLKQDDEKKCKETAGIIIHQCEPRLSECYLSLKIYEEKKVEIENGKTNQITWRLKDFLGYNRVDDEIAPYKGRNLKIKDNTDIVLIDDAGLSFRAKSNASSWPDFINEPNKMPSWIHLKNSRPLAKGDLWMKLTYNGNIQDRLIVSMSINDIRSLDVKVSKGLSWERTALDLIHELEENPQLSDFFKCQFLIISFGLEGALVVENAKDIQHRQYWLIFDPELIEGEWPKSKDIEGTAVGFHSCIAASICYNLAKTEMEIHEEKVKGEKVNEAFKRKECIIGAIGGGLQSGRNLLMEGYKTGNHIDHVQFPKEEIVKGILETTNSFERVRVPIRRDTDNNELLPRDWTIVSQDGIDESSKPSITAIQGLAKRVAIYGPKVGLAGIPRARFGHLLTADRLEAEGFRNIKAIIENYIEDIKIQKPLGLAVFGPPGSGKSFGIKQVCKGILKDDYKLLEYNLTQFDNPTIDLNNAFHQIRDEVLRGNTPVVFWDEFDSDAYSWLKYFLVPLQDGQFQEGQITHPIGRSIFVFAGGVNETFEKFKEKAESEEKELKEAKGPDFISRLLGFLNVLGPNPYEHFKNSEGKQLKDKCYGLRRALLMRSLMKLDSDVTWKVDQGLLNALLEVNQYNHGSRSMENLLKTLKTSEDHELNRSKIPARAILSQFVESPDDFLSKVTNLDQFSDELVRGDEVPRAIHDNYNEQRRKEEQKRLQEEPDYKPQELKEFNDLSELKKDSNRAAARRIPKVLSIAGLKISKDRTKNISEEEWKNILSASQEEMAIEEHNLWMDYMISQNWSNGVVRDDANNIHTCIKSYHLLEESEKDKDREAVSNYKKVLEKVGLYIVKD